MGGRQPRRQEGQPRREIVRKQGGFKTVEMRPRQSSGRGRLNVRRRELGGQRIQRQRLNV